MPSEKCAACRGSVEDEMRMITACFARAPQRCTSRTYMHVLLMFQEVRPISKTRNQLRVIPDGSVGGDLHLTRPFALPRRHEPWSPWGPLIRQHRLQRWPALACEPGPAYGPRGTRGWGILEGRIKTPTRDDTATAQGLDFVQQLQRRQTAVGHQGDLSSRQPAHDEPPQRPRPCRQGLMATASLRREALGGTQSGQQGQRPDALSPGERDQDHACEPAQATGFDHMRVRGPHGGAGEAFGSDLIATSAFESVIKATHDNTARDAHGHEEPEQQPTGGERRPDGAMQDPMIRLKVRRGAEAHDP